MESVFKQTMTAFYSILCLFLATQACGQNECKLKDSEEIHAIYHIPDWQVTNFMTVSYFLTQYTKFAMELGVNFDGCS